MYVDYFCTICGAFEQANGSQIDTWLETGAATVEIHPLAVLDRVSQGTKYSTRSANAAACVANYSPNQYFAFHKLLFASQPEENTAGLTDEELHDLTVKAKVLTPSIIATCIEEQKFKTWVSEANDRALTGPIPYSNVEAIASPPTILVNGMKYNGAANDSAEFAAFVAQAAGAAFNEGATSTPTPTPTPAP
jgi:protein-disulfide isomerase